MNATQIATIQSAVKTGFTFAADSIFKSVRAGKTAIGVLVKAGYLEFEENEYGGQYIPTIAARDFVTYKGYVKI